MSCQLVDLSSHPWMLNGVREQTSLWTTIKQLPAAIVVYMTSGKHPILVWWSRGVAEDGHEMSQPESASWEEEVESIQPTKPRITRWNSQEPTFCESLLKRKEKESSQHPLKAPEHWEWCRALVNGHSLRFPPPSHVPQLIAVRLRCH